MDKAEFENTTFSKQNYCTLSLKHKLFSHVIFETCDFTESDWRGSKFIECTFIKCNLSLVKLDGCRLQEVSFEKCKLVGVNFTKCDPLFLHLKFQECLIDTCNFSDLNLKNTPFGKSVIRETYFTNTNLSHADFGETDLKGSTFHNTQLNHANFKSAINYSINPLTNALVKARFSEPEVLALLYNLGILIE